MWYIKLFIIAVALADSVLRNYFFWYAVTDEVKTLFRKFIHCLSTVEGENYTSLRCCLSWNDGKRLAAIRLFWDFAEIVWWKSGPHVNRIYIRKQMVLHMPLPNHGDSCEGDYQLVCHFWGTETFYVGWTDPLQNCDIWTRIRSSQSTWSLYDSVFPMLAWRVATTCKKLPREFRSILSELRLQPAEWTEHFPNIQRVLNN